MNATTEDAVKPARMKPIYGVIAVVVTVVAVYLLQFQMRAAAEEEKRPVDPPTPKLTAVQLGWESDAQKTKLGLFKRGPIEALTSEQESFLHQLAGQRGDARLEGMRLIGLLGSKDLKDRFLPDVRKLVHSDVSRTSFNRLMTAWTAGDESYVKGLTKDEDSMLAEAAVQALDRYNNRPANRMGSGG